jgi:hypothetical protein
MTGTYLSPGIGGAGGKALFSLIAGFPDICQNTLSRSKGLQGRLVDSDFPAESRLQKIPIQTIQDFFAMQQERQQNHAWPKIPSEASF